MTLQNLSGLQLDRYELRDILGVGGMGVAYRAYQSNLERDVAVKVLSPDLAAQPGYIDRFNREAKTAAALEHNHIVPVYDYGVQGDISYVVMRLLTGGSLDRRMVQRAKDEAELPSLGEVAQLLRQLGSALDYAHQSGVIHRDIKPANIMFDDQGQAFVVDFGIAKLLETTTAFTETGAAMGTPIYMPPEQWRSEALTPAADQYALGVTVYHLLTGRLPFEATTPYGMLLKHLQEDPVAPQTYRPDMPPELQTVLERALAKSPADRYPTTSAFAQEFEALVQAQSGAQFGTPIGFFTTPILITPPGGSNSIGIRIHPDSPLITQSAPPRRGRMIAFWLVSVAVAVIVTVLLLSQLDGGDEGASSSAISPTIVPSTEVEDPTHEADEQATTIALIGATQEAEVNATATELAQTAFNETATAVSELQVLATEVSSERATETQHAVDLTAEVNAAATVAAIQTEVVAQTTATAAAWTPTPTSESTNEPPDPSSLPSPTDQSTAEPPPPTQAGVPPDLRAIYTDEQFLLLNVSRGNLDAAQLVFEQLDGDTVVRSLAVSDWWELDDFERVTIGPGACLQFVSSPTIVPGTVDPVMCPNGVEQWARSTVSARFFWRGDNGAQRFVVRVQGTPQPIKECTISTGECDVRLPERNP